MKYLVLVLMFALVGCSTVKVEPDISDRYSNLESMEIIIPNVTVLPERPQLTVKGDLAYLDLNGVQSLLMYRNVAETNTEALTNLIYMYNELVVQYNELLELLRLEEERGNFYAEAYAGAETSLSRQSALNSSIVRVQTAIILVLTGALAL